MTSARAALVGLALVATLAGCTEDEPRSPSASATSPSGSETVRADPSPSVSPGPASPGSAEGPQGSPASPVALDAEPAPLDWRTVPGPADATVTVSGEWTLTQRDTEVVLEGPRAITVDAPRRHRVTDALIDGAYAVVVTEDELSQQPNTATVIDLATGERTVVDGDSDVPTTTGGTWALGEGRLAHATLGRDRAYCLASVELATMTSETTWCAPPRHGFSDARITPTGTAILTFDAQRPSCRTVGEVDGDGLAPFEGVSDCLGWDAALVDDGAVWSVVPKAQRIEEAHFYARSADGWFDLGPGTSGSLTWCGGAAYFVRDPQRSGDPAQLMAWSGERLQVAYESSGRGQAFLAAPRCGGDQLTVAALTESGDAQVTASVR